MSILKTYDENWASGSTYSSIDVIRNRQGDMVYLTGYVVVKSIGAVHIYHQGHEGSDKLLSLSFHINGRSFFRSIRGKIYTEIGIARKAGQFARDIIKNHRIFNEQDMDNAYDIGYQDGISNIKPTN